MTAQKKRKPGPAVKRSGNTWVFPAVVVAIVLIGVVAVVVARSGGDSGSSDGGGGGNKVEVSAEVSVDGTPLPRFVSSGKDPAVGMAAPSLGSVDFEGTSATAGGATGSPYALVFLAHYCPHCQAEVPRLVDVAEKGTIEGVPVIGIPTGTTNQAPNYPPSAWLAREDWPFPVLVDDDTGTAGQAFGLSAYPFMVFVDASGNVVGRYAGEMAEADLTKVFAALAKGQPLPLPGAGASTSS